MAMLRRIRLKLKKNQETVAEAQGLIMSSLIYEYKQFDKALKLEQLEDLFDPDTDTYVEPFEEFITKHLNNSFNNAPSAQRMKLDFVKATEAELDELGVY